MFTIKLKLVAILTVLTAAILGSGMLGYWAHKIGDEGLDTVYAERVVPMRDLKVFSDAFAVAVVDGAHKMRSGSMPYADGLKAIDEAQVRADRIFADYMMTRMDERRRRPRR